MHTCRGLQKTLQDPTARWMVFALRLGGEAAQEVSSLAGRGTWTRDPSTSPFLAGPNLQPAGPTLPRVPKGRAWPGPRQVEEIPLRHPARGSRARVPCPLRSRQAPRLPCGPIVAPAGWPPGSRWNQGGPPQVVGAETPLNQLCARVLSAPTWVLSAPTAPSPPLTSCPAGWASLVA